MALLHIWVIEFFEFLFFLRKTKDTMPQSLSVWCRIPFKAWKLFNSLFKPVTHTLACQKEKYLAFHFLHFDPCA